MLFLLIQVVLLAAIAPGCARQADIDTLPPLVADTVSTDTAVTSAALFDTLLADGFDFPVGDPDGKGAYVSHVDGKRYDGWYRATGFAEIYTEYEWIHTGEDWNGRGGGNTDLGQPVHAIGRGVVLFAGPCPAPWGTVVLIGHRFLENARLHTVYSQYAHLRGSLVKTGDVVHRRQVIGAIGQDPDGLYHAHLHLEIRRANAASLPVDYWPSSNGKDTTWVRAHYLPPTEFIDEHRRLTVPAAEPEVLVAVKHEYTLTHYKDGGIAGRYDIALSQEPVGHKQVVGDNRLPEGEYRIIQKARGPFSHGAYAHYLGVAWMRLSYPNNYDARAGLAGGSITRAEHDRIVAANNAGTEPPKNTALGGGIGIHGWAGDWPEDTRALTWGCISMRNEDLARFYGEVSLGTTILILP